MSSTTVGRAPTWRALLAEVETALGTSRPPVEARRIIERASGYDGPELALHLGEPVPERALPFVAEMLARLAKGEPLQYVVGRWGFRGLDLMVDRRVLIPRPETEVVAEIAIRELARPARAARAARAAPADRLVVDLGTGSGAIALAIAREAPRARVLATDVSPDALAVARANLAGLGSGAACRVQLLQGSWFDPLPHEVRGTVDLIVSNPPYIGEDEPLPPEVADWEPRTALIAGPTGMEAVATIVAGSPAWLARPGALVMEIAPHQAEEATSLAEQAGFSTARVRPDLQGRLRVLVASVDP